MVRNGGTSPLAVRRYTVAEWFPMFETHSSSFLESTNSPVGFLSPVFGPRSTRVGAMSPPSVVRKTKIESPESFATNRSPLS